jgi:hypothetical protein
LAVESAKNILMEQIDKSMSQKRVRMSVAGNMETPPRVSLSNFTAAQSYDVSLNDSRTQSNLTEETFEEFIKKRTSSTSRTSSARSSAGSRHSNLVPSFVLDKISDKKILMKHVRHKGCSFFLIIL